MGSFTDWPPLIWVAIGVAIVFGAVRGLDHGNPWDRVGCVALIILVVVGGLLFLGIEWAWDLLDWLLESPY